MKPDLVKQKISVCHLYVSFYRKGINVYSGGKYKAEITTTRVDVSKADQVDNWITAAAKKFGKLDGAANVAGIALGKGEITEHIVRFLALLTRLRIC